MADRHLSGHRAYVDGQSNSGLLILRFSPTLGINFGVTVRIDGYEAGALTRGHVYRRHLSPGRHRLEVTQKGRQYDRWSGTINAQPGETYSYVVKNAVNQIVLQPAGVAH